MVEIILDLAGYVADRDLADMLIVEPACGAGAFHTWTRQGDYLLGQGGIQAADFVVGNPPYIRLEDVPDARMSAYRSACPTMGGRSDIYVGFYEVGLRSLRDQRKADRLGRPPPGAGRQPLPEAAGKASARVGGSRCPKATSWGRPSGWEGAAAGVR